MLSETHHVLIALPRQFTEEIFPEGVKLSYQLCHRKTINEHDPGLAGTWA